jgi:hypothetical protein
MDTFNVRLIKCGEYTYFGDVGYDKQGNITDISAPLGGVIIDSDDDFEDIRGVLGEQMLATEHPVVDCDDLDLLEEDKETLTQILRSTYFESVSRPIFMVSEESRDRINGLLEEAMKTAKSFDELRDILGK